MSMDNYPGGFNEGILIRGMPLQVTHPGKIFWVYNGTAVLPNQKGGSDGNDGSFNAPFATLDYAIGRCTANRGDIIMLKPGHAENLAAAAAITSDIAGVAVIGLGTGTLRPKFSWTLDTADWNITANNCSFYNINFQANYSDVASMLDVSAVAGLTFSNCYFTEAGTNLNAIDFIDLATGASDISFSNCKFIGNDIANDSFITGVALDGLYMNNYFIAMNTAQTGVVGLIETSGNATNVLIKDCNFVSLVDGALFLDFNGAANTGIIDRCNFSSLDVAGAVTAGFDFTGGHMFECYVAGEADSYGLIGGGTVSNNA